MEEVREAAVLSCSELCRGPLSSPYPSPMEGDATGASQLRSRRLASQDRARARSSAAVTYSWSQSSLPV